MARISTYALDAAINDADKLIGTDADNNNQTKNFSLEGIAEYVIDKLIDPDSNQALIPVFRNIENTDGANATRITGSIMYQDTYPTGTQIGIAGNLLVEQNATVGINLSVAGESYLLGNVYLGTTPADSIKQRGTLELLAPVKDSTGTLGSSEQVLVSNASGVLSWENYQGTGLEFQSSWNANTNVPDLTAIPLDGDNTGKYWVVSVEGTTDLSGISQWSPGDWAIISQDDSDNVFWSKIDNSSVDGLGEVNKLAVWDSPKTLTFTPDIEFTAPSTLTLGNNLSSEAKIILQQYNPSIELGNTFKISHPLNGNAIISETGNGDLLLLSDNEIEIKSGELGETFARFTKDGPIELYYDNTKVFNTTATGIYVTGTQSFFSGQVTIPTTPVAGTDAASKAYVDLQNINKVSGSTVAGKYAIGGPAANTIDAGGDPTTSSVFQASMESSYVALGAQGPGYVPISTAWQHYDAGNNAQGSMVLDQQGNLTIGGSGGNGGKLIINPNGFSATPNNVLNVGGQAKIQGRVDITAGGLCVSNNPSGVQLDGTSVVIGSGDNDIIDGSDHSMIVGKANKLQKTATGSGSDQSMAIGSLNILTDASNSLAVGRGNSLIGTGVNDANGLRSQIIGLNNQLKDTFSSIVIGGHNEVNINEVTGGQNTHVLGYENTISGRGDNVYAIGNRIDLDAGGGASNFYAFGSNIKLDQNVHGVDTMAIGIRNKATLSYTPDNNKGLGTPALTVGAGSTAYGTHDALIITKQTGSGTHPGSRTILPDLVGFNFANDNDATAAGIPTGGLYRTDNDLKINFNESAAGGNEGLAYLTPQLIVGTGPMGGGGFTGTVSPNYNLVIVSWSGPNGIFTLNLPLASANTHRLIRITTDGSLDAGAADKINITATGGETIDGAASFQISKRYEGLALFSTGSEWLIVQAKAH